VDLWRACCAAEIAVVVMVVWRSRIDVHAGEAFCWSLMGIVGGINGVGCARSTDAVVDSRI